MQRVAITGAGLVTPLGLTAAENVARSCRGESGIGPAQAFAVEGHAARALASVAEFELEPFLRHPKNYKFMGRSVQFAMRAAQEAIAQSGIDLSRLDATRVGIHVGSGQTGVEYDHFFPSLIMAWDAGREMDYKYLGGLPSHLIDRYICLRTLANGGLALLSTEFGIRGPNGNFTQKDTASAQAVHAAYLDLLEERCEVAIAGGYDSLATTGNFLAYEQAGLLSHREPPEACRPFDVHSDGLVLGEGAGFLVMETWEHAARRGAAILGEFLGAGSAMGDCPQWRPAWTAATVRQAACQALGDIHPEFVVAAGLSTTDEDNCEAAALQAMVGDGVPVTALKSQTGYMGAATAAAELVLGLLCARQGFLPAIVHLRPADASPGLDLVSGEPRRLPSGARTGLYLSCSWGGAVAAMSARSIPD
ncbi:MAG TPA: beta-ketoacyl synthase N-terminal-like domain-containing protein [Bryobacteraceae bacterium]|nr:beta-ketoacyl synthase N-terminal-like domain-containing protein [Bryobacteraceae bacterium]